MAAEKGSAFLLKVGNGGSPPSYATVGGMRTTQLSVKELVSSAFVYDVALQAADGAAGTLVLSVRQAGDHGLSQAVALTLD